MTQDEVKKEFDRLEEMVRAEVISDPSAGMALLFLPLLKGVFVNLARIADAAESSALTAAHDLHSRLYR